MRRTPLARALAPAAICLLASPALLANDLSGYAEFAASDIKSERETPDGERTESDTESFLQRYNLFLDRRVYPQLRFRLGGIYEVVDSALTTLDVETDTKLARLRPYFNVSLRTPLHVAELTYDRNEERRSSSVARSVKDVRETFVTSLAYIPETLPTVRFDYYRTNAYDGERLFEDRTEDRFQLHSIYRTLEELRLDYQGTYSETEDHIGESEVHDWIHTGRATYGGMFWERVRLYGDYRVTYQSIETTFAGAGEVRIPLFRLGGLSAVDEELPRIVLAPNPLLADGNTVVGAGLDLGLPDVGEDDAPRQIGADLASQEEFNNLLVWVDRDLPAAVAASFSWQVWISEDNDEWTLHTALPQVEFGPLIARFEIDFDNVVARYVKVVVRPLVPADPLAAQFPTILVTELEVQITRPADDVENNRRTTSHFLTTDARVRLLDTPSLYYEFAYFMTKSSDASTQFTLTNGLSLNHRFNPLYAVAARVADEQDQREFEERTRLLYSASLIVDPLDTLHQRLVFSGRNETGSPESRDVVSVYLFNTAEVWRGVDVNLGLGKSASERPGGDTIDSEEINAGATLVPHRTMTFNFILRDRNDEAFIAAIDARTRSDVTSREASIAYNPLAILYLFGSYRVEQRTDVPRRSFRNYSADWTPFRDGALQLGFRYDELLRSEDEAEQQIFSPRLRWNLERGSYLELAYQTLRIRATSEDIDDRSVFGNLRLAF